MQELGALISELFPGALSVESGRDIEGWGRGILHLWAWHTFSSWPRYAPE